LVIGKKAKDDFLKNIKVLIIANHEKHSILEVKNLAIGYGTKHKQKSVASDLNFSLNAGDFAAIIGVNGIGKSTLLRTIAHVQPSLQGEIKLEGQSIQDYRPEQLAKEISVVLTSPLISKNLNVQEVITLGRQPYTNWIGSISEDDNLKIKETIQMLGLENLAQNKCYELSDGQLQRVMIARALAQDTSIILLDEPTTHLDLYHKVHILKLLRSISKTMNKTVLFTSHEIELAIQLCDKMLLIDNETNPFGTPSKLKATKAFENLFPKDTLIFEPNTGTFKIQK